MLLDWPDDRVGPLLEDCEWAGDWSRILLPVDVGIHFDRVAVTILNGLPNGRKDTEKLSIDPRPFHTERRVIHGKRDRGS